MVDTFEKRERKRRQKQDKERKAARRKERALLKKQGLPTTHLDDEDLTEAYAGSDPGLDRPTQGQPTGHGQPANQRRPEVPEQRDRGHGYPGSDRSTGPASAAGSQSPGRQTPPAERNP